MATPNNTPSGNADEGKSSSYNRWSLLDPSTISYGYYSSSVSTSTNNTSDSDAPSNKGFYITTAINYTNGPAHMGHAYESATTDAIARFARMMASSSSSSSAPTAYFVTGADEHGEKIAKTAEKEGKEPIDICNKVCYCYYDVFVSVCVCACIAVELFCTNNLQ